MHKTLQRVYAIFYCYCQMISLCLSHELFTFPCSICPVIILGKWFNEKRFRIYM